MPEAQRADTPKQVVERVQADLRDFKARNKLDQVVVANVASTEPPFTPDERFAGVDKFRAALEMKGSQIPASALYAWSAVDLGLPYINFTPSLGASFSGILDLAKERKSVLAGKDGKTGETLLKSVL